MKKISAALFISIMILSTAAAFASDDIAMHPSCKYCGMDRATFAHSRVLITYDDGSTVGTCSLHCAAVDLAINIDRTPKSIQVGDYETKALIDSDKAVWVIGGSKMGVMTKRAKWAFSNMDDATRFLKERGGEITKFDQVVKASYEDMYADTGMIREKRKMAKKMQHQH